MKKLFLVCVPLLCSICFATVYGRNKVQTEQQDWWEIRSRNFTIYYPRGGEVPAETLLVHAERELRKLSEEFNYLPEEPIPVVLYISPGAFRQTDIHPYEISQAVGGFTEFYKGRVVIPFTGYWSDFRHVVAHEINHAFIFDMLYRRSLLNIITGGTPLWMMEGLAEYTSIGWDAASEAEFRDMVIANRIVSIAELSRRSDYLVYRQGQAIYHFINERYGRDKYREFVQHINARAAKDYSTAVQQGFASQDRRSPGDPFQDVFGMSREQFSEKFIEWARETYWAELAWAESPNSIGNPLYRNDERIFQFNTVVSSDGSLIAGVEYHRARFAVTVRSAVTGEVVYRPFRSGGASDATVSPLYRVCSFSPGGDSVAVSAQYVSGDRLLICSEGRSDELPFEMDLIRDPSWSPSGRHIAFAGMTSGTMNLYVWDIEAEELIQVTDDLDGERDLSWNDDRILCAVESGMDSSSIAEYGLDGSRRTILAGTFDLGYPLAVPDGILFMSNMHGYSDLYLITGDEEGPIRLTALYRTIDYPSWAAGPGILTFISQDWSGPGVFLAYNVTGRRAAGRDSGSLESLPHPDGALPLPTKTPVLPDTVSRPAATGGRTERVSGFEDTEEVPSRREDGPHGYSIAPYSPRLTVDYASAMASYDSYLGVAGYTQVILSDVLSHHQVVVNTNLDGGSVSDVDIALFYGYLPRRTDYIAGLMRESYRYLFRFPDGHYEEVRDIDTGGFLQARYPLSPSMRLSGTLSYRSLSRTGTWNSTADVNEDIFSLQGGIVFDNALWGYVGPRVGRRLSLLGDYAPPFAGSAEYMTLLVDFRNYVWVSQRVTLALRLAGGASWGPDGQSFFLGGAIPHRLLWGQVETIDELLGFYTNYGDMLRGYDYASVRGRKYGLFSAEMRVPFLRTLALDAPLPLTIRNGRGVFFLDLGTAFDDFSDFRGASTEDGFRLQDLKVGLGLGYRLNLGYFLLKHDIAWRTDLRGISRRPEHYITLGAEF